ncbi:MAG: class I SAM-dependent methyltransferase [Phycisphaerales bacterium]|nr:class I SAM-dependent methyltransferase [Phycisphaerales bacterium]
MPPQYLCCETDKRVAELRRRLDEFYGTTVVYDAFKATNQQPTVWAPIRSEIERLGSAMPVGHKVRVLEFGAGRTGFGDYLGELRNRIEFHTQDVTPQNEEFLRTQCDRVHVGDVLELPGPYDVVFSTFVWEHVSNPVRVLTHLLDSLSVGGSLYIASPRYDLPGYTPPTARHYGTLSRAGLLASLTLRRLFTRLGGRPAFLIHTDPSMFHRPWYRDADAIHWVSLHDLRRALPEGFELTLPPTTAPAGLKGRIWHSFCLLFVKITKTREGKAKLRGVESAA